MISGAPLRRSHKKKVTVEMPLQLYKWLHDYAASTEQTVPSVIRGAVEDFRDDLESGANDDWWETWKSKNRGNA